MQRKLPLRYSTTTRAVYEEVKRHLQDHQIKVPPEWKSLVVLGCLPFMAQAPPANATNIQLVDKAHKLMLRDFQRCFRHLPDLTLTILSLTRRYLARYKQNSKNKAGLVRLFLLENPLLVKENGNYRTPEEDELDILWERLQWERKGDPRFKQEITHHKKGKPPIKSVPIALLQDGEIAQILSRPGFDVATETVKKARRSLSRKVKT